MLVVVAVFSISHDSKHAIALLRTEKGENKQALKECIKHSKTLAFYSLVTYSTFLDRDAHPLSLSLT